MSDLETEKRQMRDISSTEGGKNEGTGTHQETDEKKLELVTEIESFYPYYNDSVSWLLPLKYEKGMRIHCFNATLLIPIHLTKKLLKEEAPFKCFKAGRFLSQFRAKLIMTHASSRSH